MKAIKQKNKQRLRRRRHVRSKISGTAARPRLSVQRSLQHLRAQLIDDENGRTLAAVSSTARALTDQLGGKKKTERAAVMGAELARKAREAGIAEAIFDRGHCRYHGRIKAFAEAAREGGLKF